jgi:membrane associated rhomboid family serine protease
MLTQIADQLLIIIQVWQKHLVFLSIVIGSLYLIYFINILLKNRLFLLGIYPRNWWSLSGIVFYPFIHGNFNHLFFNSIPLFLLGGFVLLQGINIFLWVTLVITLISGAGIWLLARSGCHIGASGVVMGYWSYLLTISYLHGISVITLGPALICIYYFGGFLFQIVPSDIKSSWEAHLFGFIGGITAAYITPIM